MANHCYVRTRKKMTPEAISEVIQNLNNRVFKNLIQTEYTKGDKNSWGPHIWISVVNDQLGPWQRVCWLQTAQRFEQRHGVGGDFAWWWDTALSNEIAVIFNGTISDDGVGEKWKGVPNKFDNPKDFLHLMCYRDGQEELMYRWFLQSKLEFFPEAFQFDTGKKVIFKEITENGQKKSIITDSE